MTYLKGGCMYMYLCVNFAFSVIVPHWGAVLWGAPVTLAGATCVMDTRCCSLWRVPVALYSFCLRYAVYFKSTDNNHLLIWKPLFTASCYKIKDSLHFPRNKQNNRGRFVSITKPFSPHNVIVQYVTLWAITLTAGLFILSVPICQHSMI